MPMRQVSSLGSQYKRCVVAPVRPMRYFLYITIGWVKSLKTVLHKTVLTALILVAASLSGTITAAEQGYYKWTDSGGRPQLSDRPPPAGVEYEFVSTDTGRSRRISAEESSAAAGSTAAAMPKPEAPEPTEAEKQVLIEKNPDLCDQARANIDTLNSKARVRIRDADGAIRYLTPDEKDVQRQKADDLMAVHCP
jgi:hypothetical protein